MALKKTSSTLVISVQATETAANTFTQAAVDLALDPLNNEVFVVQAINVDAQEPDSVAGTTTRTGASISTTSRTTLGSLADTNVMAVARESIVMNAGSVDGAPFSRTAAETFQAEKLEYIGIIATNDFFVQIEGANNTSAKSAAAKIYGFRAKMDSSGYAALVQSELLSQ